MSTNSVRCSCCGSLVRHQPDIRFRLVKTFGLVVPEDYSHPTCLGSLRNSRDRSGRRLPISFFDEDITDKNFAKVTIRLNPGERLKVDIFDIRDKVSSEDCLVHLYFQRALLVGAQGASLMLGRSEMLSLSDRFLISFDEKDNLWKNTIGDSRLTLIRQSLRFGDLTFRTSSFEKDWPAEGYYLLCFREDE